MRLIATAGAAAVDEARRPGPGCMAVIMMVVALPALARAQSEMDAPPEIFLHPDVSTVLHMPDEIEHMRLTVPAAGMIRGTFVANLLYLRPRRGVSAGTDAWVDVTTATVRRRFRLRVVRRARDASQSVLVLAAEPPAHAPDPAPPEPHAGREPATPIVEEPTSAESERDTATVRAPRFELSVHALAALGTTAVHIPGYQATNARQSHRAFGMRVAGTPHGTWWSVEGNVTWELPVTPTTHMQVGDPVRNVLEVNGPRLRADVGLRGRFGARLMLTFHAALGLQAHHLDGEAPDDPTGNTHRGDLPFEGVLALGMGLEYRAGNVSLGVDLHVRQGVPAGYRSVSGVLFVGFFLDQGE